MTQPAPKPHKLPFQLQRDETVILFTRRHWIFLWSRLLLQAFFGLVPVVAITILTAKTAGFGGIAGKAILALDAVILLYWGIRAYFTWYAYINDIWVVTNQRILDGTKANWFKSHLASADLVDVEDIAVERSGLLPTMFNFGELRCQTAGERMNFTLEGIPAPQHFLATIDAARDTARRQSTRPLA